MQGEGGIKVPSINGRFWFRAPVRRSPWAKSEGLSDFETAGAGEANAYRGA